MFKLKVVVFTFEIIVHEKNHTTFGIFLLVKLPKVSTKSVVEAVEAYHCIAMYCLLTWLKRNQNLEREKRIEKWPVLESSSCTLIEWRGSFVYCLVLEPDM